ncbi:MAG: hypothetical protein ACYCQJ_03410 [Nitrososphaerales archaeon]
MKNHKAQRKRRNLAVSAVLGTVLMIGITVAVGFAAWAWASSAAVSSENNFGNSIGSNINYLKENFDIANVNFSSSNEVTVWFYNAGNVTVYIQQIWISNSTWSEAMIASSQNCASCIKLSVGMVTPSTFTINTAFVSGSLYQFKALGEYGNTYTYQQTR